MFYQEAITEYKGTVITVSHDRYFIKQIVNRVVEVKDCNLQDYAGDYNVCFTSLSQCPFSRFPWFILCGYFLEFQCLQYYLEKNLDAREKDLEREAELEEKAPKVKAKSKMSKVNFDSLFAQIAR